jgi:hypothetical protein
MVRDRVVTGAMMLSDGPAAFALISASTRS